METAKSQSETLLNVSKKLEGEKDSEMPDTLTNTIKELNEKTDNIMKKIVHLEKKYEEKKRVRLVFEHLKQQNMEMTQIMKDIDIQNTSQTDTAGNLQYILSQIQSLKEQVSNYPWPAEYQKKSRKPYINEKCSFTNDIIVNDQAIEANSATNLDNKINKTEKQISDDPEAGPSNHDTKNVFSINDNSSNITNIERQKNVNDLEFDENVDSKSDKTDENDNSDFESDEEYNSEESNPPDNINEKISPLAVNKSQIINNESLKDEENIPEKYIIDNEVMKSQKSVQFDTVPSIQYLEARNNLRNISEQQQNVPNNKNLNDQQKQDIKKNAENKKTYVLCKIDDKKDFVYLQKMGLKPMRLKELKAIEGGTKVKKLIEDTSHISEENVDESDNEPPCNKSVQVIENNRYVSCTLS